MPSPSLNDPQAILNAAATSARHGGQRPRAQILTAALLASEKHTRQHRQEIDATALHGRWRLCFTAGKQARYMGGEPSGSGFYIPNVAAAYLSFSPTEASPIPLRITNQLQILGSQIQFTGPAVFHQQKNLLVFDFTELELGVAGRPIYRTHLGPPERQHSFTGKVGRKTPFFAFFAATESYVAARGRGGGLALWCQASAEAGATIDVSSPQP